MRAACGMSGKPGWWILYVIILTTLLAHLVSCSSTASPEKFYKEDCKREHKTWKCNKQ